MLERKKNLIVVFYPCETKTRCGVTSIPGETQVINPTIHCHWFMSFRDRKGCGKNHSAKTKSPGSR